MYRELYGNLPEDQPLTWNLQDYSEFTRVSSFTCKRRRLFKENMHYIIDAATNNPTVHDFQAFEEFQHFQKF